MSKYDNWGLSNQPPVTTQRWKLHTVTAISCARLIGAPIFIFLFVSPLASEHAASLPFLVLIFLTDIADGFLARRWSVTTHFGYVLDGVADRGAHIAVIVALTARRELSSILGFLLILRDLILYAARALFATWWAANARFRFRVRLAAVLFKVTVGGIVVLSYVRDLHLPLFIVASPQTIAEILRVAAWVFTVWSYVLLAQQIRQYAIISDDGETRR